MRLIYLLVFVLALLFTGPIIATFADCKFTFGVPTFGMEERVNVIG
jgi:hypothetical protein